MKYKQFKAKLNEVKSLLDFTSDLKYNTRTQQFKFNSDLLSYLFIELCAYRKTKINFNRDPLYKQFEKQREKVMKHQFGIGK